MRKELRLINSLRKSQTANRNTNEVRLKKNEYSLNQVK